MENDDIIIIKQSVCFSREDCLKIGLEKLLSNFSDVPDDDISDILKLYSEKYRLKAMAD